MRKDSVRRLEQHGVKRIPEGWTQSRVKYLGAYINGYPFKPDDWGTVGRPILRIQDLSSANGEPNRFDGEIPDRYLVRPRDILISWSASLGVYRWVGEEAWLNQHIFKVSLDAKRVRDDFFVWLAEWFINEMDREVHGSTMQHLTADAFGGFPVLLPPNEGQARIADYLDRETARLDALIAAKERVLGLLAEKRRALITRAVTRGIDPRAPLRDSGIHWLGEIPAHWEVVRLRFCAHNIEQGWSPQGENRQPANEEWGVLKLNAVNKGQFDDSAAKALPEDVVPLTDLEVRAGDFLMTRSNTPALVGDACFVEITRPRLMLCDLIYRLTLRSEAIDGRFLGHFLTLPIGRRQIESDARGTSASMVKISQEHIKDWLIPLPSVDEQQAIIAQLAQVLAPLDRIHAATTHTIALLKERRAARIAAAVTGLIDIRLASSSETAGSPIGVNRRTASPPERKV